MAQKFINVTSQGFPELAALFNNLPAQVETQVLGAGVTAGARVIAKAAKKAAPRGSGRQSPASKKFGTLDSNITSRLLNKRVQNVRAAIVTRGGSFWGDLLNRGTRYIPATRWYDAVLAQSLPTALSTMRDYFVAKTTQVSLKAIEQYGANKK